jgi:hemolysin activation/secretion protein
MQLTPNRLVPAQQFRIGGLYSVRGYPEGDFLGDYGFQGSLELRVPPYFVPKDWTWPATERSVRDSLRAVCFVDMAQGYLNAPKFEDESTQHLLGIGGGIRVNINDLLQARAEVGIPIGADQSSDGKNARLHFVLRAGF